MERVTFLLDERPTERISCLLNPESLVVRRRAGILSRASTAGRLTGTGQADDALLYTGGGTTELDLVVLFDIAVAGSTIQSEDVRDLTAPLWRLAENHHDSEGRAQAPLVRFVWGKSWNIPGVVVAVAERLERFSAGGAPGRSWLRLRFRRLAEPAPEGAMDVRPPLSPEQLIAGETVDELGQHRLVGDGDGNGETLDQLAQRYYGHPSFWRLLAQANEAIEDPLQLPENEVLTVPVVPREEPSP